jgi:vibriolysin
VAGRAEENIIKNLTLKKKEVFIMKRKKWLNSKIFFTILVLCCFMATSTWAAKKVEFYKKNANDYIKKLNGNEKPGKALGLTQDEEFKLLRKRTDAKGTTHYRYQQTYKGIPLWGHQTVISKNSSNKVVTLHGNMILDIPRDITAIPSSLDPASALRTMIETHKKKDPKAAWHFENEKNGTYIYFQKENKKAVLCYVVSFFADTEKGNPSHYTHFIDVKTGKVLESHDWLQYADGTGPGGNQKIGLYEYGVDFPPFGVTQNGSTCTMDTTDVKTVNLNHGTTGSTAYSYTCPRNTVMEINGAYSPLNDAQFFGQVVYDMYNGWYGVPPLTFQLTMRVHYSTNYENAFWNGSSMTFGDGYTTFYPLVALDVSAHEVSHGFTEQNSGLIYSSQSGGINEAFSDMAGESAEYFSRGSTDFRCGYDIFKNPTGALRYLYDPPLDGISIDHVSQYYEGLNVHYSSGIFNKAFYLIATSPGWNTKMAFDVFVKANQDYWTPSTNFQQGAEGAMNAAVDLGYSCQAVVDAFAVVGIDLVCPGPPVADFSASLTSGGVPLTTTFTDQSQAASSWLWDFGDTGTSTQQNPTHTYNAMGTYTVTLTATNEFGSDVAVKTNYITVTAPVAPIADFSASATDINIGNSVTFTDLSLENPASWSWTFEGGTPATSTAQNPTVTYNSVGTFDVTLVATNPQGSDTMTKVGYITVSVKPYCASQGNTFSMEWVAGVQVGSMNNASGAAGYTDFTSITCNLVGGNNVNVTLTPGFSGSTYTEYWKIWIDYNDDHDFDDAGEEVFSGVGSSTVTGSFTVASGVNIVSRMRVSMKYAGYPTPCESFTYGEVEDYTVSVVDGGCPTPVANFSASATTIYEGESVTFSDQTTNNPDTWDWTFSGGTPASSTQQNPTVTYNTAGTYTVSLTASNTCGSDTNTKTNYITVIAPTEIFVFDITQTIGKKGKNYDSTAVVTIRDTNNAPVANATVSIAWSGVVSGSDSGTTGSDGTVTFASSKVKSAGPFIITVTNVTHAVLPYNPALNNETSDSATY